MKITIHDRDHLTQFEAAAITSAIASILSGRDPSLATGNLDDPPTDATITGLEQAAKYLAGRPVERDTSPAEDRKTRFQAMLDRMIPPFQGPVTPLPPDAIPAALAKQAERQATTAPNHLAETKQFRREIGAILASLQLATGDEVDGDARDYRTCRDSEERLQAANKLREALMWLAEDLKQIGKS